MKNRGLNQQQLLVKYFEDERSIWFARKSYFLKILRLFFIWSLNLLLSAPLHKITFQIATFSRSNPSNNDIINLVKLCFESLLSPAAAVVIYSCLVTGLAWVISSSSSLLPAEAAPTFMHFSIYLTINGRISFISPYAPDLRTDFNLVSLTKVILAKTFT